jgi:Purple acid Phosphatase, N-terminal domain
VRLLAVVVVFAALAGTAAAATDNVQVAASSSSATVTWQTTAPTRGRVVYGVGGLYLYSARESTASTAHSVTLDDLNPSTTYSFRVGSDAGQLTTTARPAAVRFGTDGTRITADGSLFLPVLSYEQCADTFGRAQALGVNTFVQVPFTGCSQPVTVAPPYVLSDQYGAQNGSGWYLPDEPDGWGITPEQMPHLPPATQTGRLRVANVSQHFFSGQAPINSHFDRNDYKRFAALADVIGFDMYPIVKFCGRIPLIDMFRAQRELMTIYAPGKPTFQWIETSRMTGECPSLHITPQIVNAETWLAIAGGACGIAYFTNSWTGDLWNRWDFDPGVEQQIASTVAGVQRLAPALCAAYGSVLVPWDGSVAASSRTLNGALYVIAVNGSGKPTRVPFRVDALAGRTLTVLDEARTIEPMKKVYFRDSFAPYQVHVYVASPIS